MQISDNILPWRNKGKNNFPKEGEEMEKKIHCAQWLYIAFVILFTLYHHRPYNKKPQCKSPITYM